MPYQKERPAQADLSFWFSRQAERATPSERQRLLAETLNISDSNPSDALREPAHAHRLNPLTYRLPGSDVPYKQTILHGSGMTIVGTSYANSIQEVTDPATEFSMRLMLFEGRFRIRT